MLLHHTFRQELERRFVDNPGGRAIQFKRQQLTNAELAAALMTLRHDLKELNGSRVALLLPDSLEAYLLYLHLFLEGATIIPIPVHATAQRIQHICESVQATLLITNALLYRAHHSVLQLWPCAVLQSAAEISSTALRFERPSEVKGPSSPAGEDGCVRFIIFTSGSTGTPKGVCLSEENILAAADMMVRFLPLDDTTLSLVTVPLYDYYGMIQVFGHILGGGAYVFGLNAGVPGQVLDAIRSAACTDLVVVPYTLRTLLKGREPAAAGAFGALRRVTSSSDILTEDLLGSFFTLSPQATVVNIYGLTEAGRACYRKITRATPFTQSIGVPAHGVEIEIRDASGGVGEIVIRGPNVMLGYLRGVESGRIVFNPCTEMPTGDLGYLDRNAEIVLLGRRDHMINLMGLKIHPSEIEMAALKAGVTDARARVCDSKDGDKAIHLDVVCKDSDITAEGIIEKMRLGLPRPFIPKTVTFQASIQRTDIGAKIVR